jgi:hypothetical protein
MGAAATIAQSIFAPFGIQIVPPFLISNPRRNLEAFSAVQHLGRPSASKHGVNDLQSIGDQIEFLPLQLY